ncbi:diacylglycerol kinase family protein [Candidatus Nomurabacteria bacterium]|nr:diacylglycerol kinase family protein [Candidatus Nomurabacteria bacterium]
MKEKKSSFAYAVLGMKYVYVHERNFRIQCWSALVVVACAFFFGLSPLEFVAILFLIMTVLILEMLNSALEKFVDILKPRLDLHVGVVKDIMAGMVLLSSLGAAIVGLIIFYPYVISLFG